MCRNNWHTNIIIFVCRSTKDGNNISTWPNNIPSPLLFGDCLTILPEMVEVIDRYIIEKFPHKPRSRLVQMSCDGF